MEPEVVLGASPDQEAQQASATRLRGIETVPPADATDSPASLTDRRPRDVIGLAQLWADQFKHLATLGVAGAGGVLILLQARVMERDWWLILGLFAMAAVLSMYGHMDVVDGASEDRAPGVKPRILRGLAFACLGAAGGAAISALAR